MRIPRPRRRAERWPVKVRDAVRTGPGEQLLAMAVDERGGHVVATNHRLCAVESGRLTTSRPWHLVDAGRWNHDTFTLSVSWVDGAATSRWVLREPGLLPETVRERVQASVVLAERVDVPGRGTVRVVIRSDVAAGALLDQVILGRGMRRDDPDVASRVEALRAQLREQVGLV